MTTVQTNPTAKFDKLNVNFAQTKITNTDKREVKHIPTAQIKGQYLLISKGNCGGKCSYK